MNFKKTVANTILIVVGISLVALIFILAFRDLTVNETALLTVLLTFISFVFSWMLSTYVSNISHKKVIDDTNPQRSSNLRVKKRFTDKEKDDFLKESFEYIYKFFRNSLVELEDRNSFIDYNLDKMKSQPFPIKLYSEEKLVSQCKIWHVSDFTSTESIKYSNSISSTNSFN